MKRKTNTVDVDDALEEMSDKLVDEILPDDNVDSIIPESELQKRSRIKCPRCKKNSLELDVANGSIKCTNCGFSERLPGMR